MSQENLQEKLNQLEREIRWYFKERDKVQTKLTNLQAEKDRLLQGLEIGSFKPVLQTNNQQNISSLLRVVRPVNILNTLEKTKSRLEELDRNLNKTFQTVDDVVNLISVLSSYRGNFKQIFHNLSNLTSSKDDVQDNRSMSGLLELTKLPLVRNLAKEVIGMVNRP